VSVRADVSVQDLPARTSGLPVARQKAARCPAVWSKPSAAPRSAVASSSTPSIATARSDLWGTSALPGDKVAEVSFFARLQKNVLNRGSRNIRGELRIAIVTWTEGKHRRRRRQAALGLAPSNTN